MSQQNREWIKDWIESELSTWEKRNLFVKLRQCITPSIVAHVIGTHTRMLNVFSMDSKQIKK